MTHYFTIFSQKSKARLIRVKTVPPLAGKITLLGINSYRHIIDIGNQNFRRLNPYYGRYWQLSWVISYSVGTGSWSPLLSSVLYGDVCCAYEWSDHSAQKTTHFIALIISPQFINYKPGFMKVLPLNEHPNLLIILELSDCQIMSVQCHIIRFSMSSCVLIMHAGCLQVGRGYFCMRVGHHRSNRYINN